MRCCWTISGCGLGDAGAHALGALLGAAFVIGTGRPGLMAHAVAVVGAAVYGE